MRNAVLVKSTLPVRGWFRIPEAAQDDDPGIERYLGYGESLLDCNARSIRFGVGFILREW